LQANHAQFETLRLFTPVLHTTRQIWEDQQITDAQGTRHYLTAPMMVYVSAQSMHLDRAIWGPDALAFNPARWLDAGGELITPTKGTFLPWSGGPRVCPGMKFSQVEFAAVFATLFRSARCEPLRQGAETELAAQARLEGIMAESISKLTMQVRDPAEVRLRWTRV
jgi:cytochrome P450